MESLNVNYKKILPAFGTKKLKIKKNMSRLIKRLIWRPSKVNSWQRWHNQYLKNDYLKISQKNWRFWKMKFIFIFIKFLIN